MIVRFFRGTGRGRARIGELTIERGKLVAKGGGATLKRLAEGLTEGEPRVFTDGARVVTIKDGDTFLEALPLLFRPPYFFAEVVDEKKKKTAFAEDER